MTLHATAIDYEGKLAIAGPMTPDYDQPMMGRLIWITKHKFDPRWAEFQVIAGPQQGDAQPWALVSPLGGRVEFSTAAHGQWHLIAPIKPPRQKKGARPWRWEAGKWVNHNPNI